MLKRFKLTKRKDKLNTLVNDKSNSDKLDIIISEIKTIKSDLTDFRDEFNKYKKQNSDFQEAHVNNFIISVLDHNRSTYITTLLPIKNIYIPYSQNPLSELDGLILYTPTQTKMPNISSELLEKTRDFYQTLKENISQIDSTFAKPYLIIVESKRSLNKHKVDMKLKQIYEFMKILSRLDTIDLATTTLNFQEMISKLQKHSNLSINELTTIDVVFILGSDDISLNLRKYALEIENGINKEMYNSLSEELFKEDTFKDTFIKSIIESRNTTKLVKSKLKHYKTLEELKTIVNSDLANFNMEYLSDYLTPYEDIEHIFREFKGKIGIAQFNRVEMPKLLQFTIKS